MKSNLVFTVGILAALTALVCCQDMDFYCGRKLTEALAAKCPNGLIKRTGDQLYSVGDEEWSWIPEQLAKSPGRKKRQVVDECCFKPCAMSELLAYCAE